VASRVGKEAATATSQSRGKLGSRQERKGGGDTQLEDVAAA